MCWKCNWKKALSLGFQNVITAEGNVRTLKELILQNFNSSAGKMLYVSGEIISNDLDKNLASLGYNVKRIINYSSKPNYELDEKFIEKLRVNMPDIVYIYSQNSALSFLKLINNENITLEAELFSLDGKERFYCKSSKDIKHAAELGIEIGENLKSQSRGSYKK